MNTAEFLLAFVQGWLTVGGIVAALFLTIGIDRIDEDSHGAYAFRPLLIPGILLIWPMVIWRWWSLKTGGFDPNSRYKPVRAAHAVIAVGLCVLVIGISLLGLSVRQTWPADFEPQKISDAGDG